MASLYLYLLGWITRSSPEMHTRQEKTIAVAVAIAIAVTTADKRKSGMEIELSNSQVFVTALGQLSV